MLPFFLVSHRTFEVAFPSFIMFFPTFFLISLRQKGRGNGPCKYRMVMAWVEMPHKSRAFEALGGCLGRIRRYGLAGENTSLGASIEVSKRLRPFPVSYLCHLFVVGDVSTQLLLQLPATCYSTPPSWTIVPRKP